MNKELQQVTRRRVLITGLAGSCAAIMSPAALAAAATAEENQNVKVVVDFCKAWATHDIDQLIPFIGENCAIRWSERSQWISGRDAVIARMKQLLDTTERVELEIVETYPKGSLVLNERIDRTARQGQVNSHRLSGIFFVKGGKIIEWSDYAM